MAQSDVVRKPTAVTEEVDLNQIKVKLLVDGLIPVTFGNKKKAKNGEVDVTFFKYGLDMEAKVRKSDGQETKWRFRVKKLPSEIVINRSTWKVDKGMVVITLEKKDEISWVAMLRRGLEQESSEESGGSDEDMPNREKSGVADMEMVELKE